MRRRDFILASAASTLVRANAGNAQTSERPIIGYLSALSQVERPHLQVAFRNGLEAQGLIDGRDLNIVVRSAAGNIDYLARMAQELIDLKASVIVSVDTLAPASVARQLTKAIPILFVAGADPVRMGLVESLNRPGSNVTGITFMTAQLTAKRIQLLKEMAPSMSEIAFVFDVGNPSSQLQLKDAEAAAQSLKLVLTAVPFRNEEQIVAAFRGEPIRRADALVFAGGPGLTNRRAIIIPLVRASGLPASFAVREFVEAGGLMSYGTNLSGAYKLLGEYAARILKGEKPENLPVQQSTRYELVLNLKTAKALGLEFPATLLAIADEVIE